MYAGNCRPANLQRRAFLTATLFWSLGLAGGSGPLLGQIGYAGGSRSGAASVPDVLAGRVVNAVTGAPIPRVLVQVSDRSALTDSEGRFRFEQPGQAAAGLRLMKPGYSTSPEQTDGFGGAIPDGGDPGSLTLPLWPEGLLSGTVLAPDGEPLSRISVFAHRSVFDEQGHRLQIAGQTQTDSHGQFRISVSAGDYTVDSQFSPRGFERDEAVLPVSVPQVSSSNTSTTIHVGSGEEQHVELRPGMSRTHVVTLPVETTEGGPGLRITAQTSDGTSFSANAMRSVEPGAVQLNLPPGTYSLRATRFSRDGIQFGESNITVPDHDVSGAMLHLAALPAIPLEVVTDISSAQTGTSSGGARVSGNLPNVMQFNVVLEPVDADPTSPFQSGVRLTMQRDNTATLAAPPGVYRLGAGVAGAWYIRSATSRGTDLMRETLTVSPGSSPSPITLVVSNQTGSLQGTVKLSGAPAACWIYLVASGPALPQVMIRRSDPSGSFTISDVPPGSYRAVAFPYRHSANLAEPAVLNRFATHVGSVTVSTGAAGNLDLDAVPLKELAP